MTEHTLYRLRRGEISEYNGVISFKEIERVIKSKINKKEPSKINLSNYDVVELDDWPGYYIVYKKDDPSEKVRIFSKWKKDKDQMVLSEDFVREILQHIHKTGYYQVNMKQSGQDKIIQKVHRLVAKQLIKNSKPDEFDTVDHIDNNKLNNHPSNLQWTTSAENIKKAANDNLFVCNKYKIFYKNGNIQIIENLNKFCKQNNYSQSACYFVINNEQPAHKDIIKIIKL
jgi:hypothetical protein